MKRTFIKMLPLVAAVLLATSCSKDSNDDSNVVIDPVETQNVASPDNDGVTIVPLTITVNKDGNSLSKASVDVTTDEGGKNTYTQKFIAGDVLVISNSAVLNSAATFTLKSTDEGKSTATFEGELSVKPGATLTNGVTTLNAVLKNTGSDDNKKNSGVPVAGVQEVSSLAEGFEKFGYLTADNFTYNGDKTSITLVQNTAFVKVDLPFHGAKVTFKIGETETVKYLNGDEVFAIPNGTTIKSTLLNIDKTVDVTDKKMVLNIKNRSTPDNCIAGVFSVAADKQIFFSKGNLQYNVTSKEWRFAYNQYDKCHVDKDKVGKDYSSWSGKWTDLFGWGMWLDATTFSDDNAVYKSSINPLQTSSISSDYVSYTKEDETKELYKDDLNKLGSTMMGSGWYTLSKDEWEYLLGESSERSGKNGVGTITIGSNKILGLVILPDGYTKPDGVVKDFVSGTSNTEYSESDWSNMESAGAVFLPAAGSRASVRVYDAGTAGMYTSSSANVYVVIFELERLLLDQRFDWRFCGVSVRLVRSL